MLLVIGIFYKQDIKPQIYDIKTFLSSMEAKTFDLRQKMLVNKKKTSKKIVIIGVDNLSQEYLSRYYGTWPMPRSVYSDIIDYIQTYKPAAVGIDVLFVDSWKKTHKDDIKLANTFAKYDNVYTAMYFDNYTPEQRSPYHLPDHLKASVSIESDNFNPYSSSNFRNILPNIINKTKNIGHINLERDNDGIVRTLPIFWGYPRYRVINHQYKEIQTDYYPNLGLKVLLKYLEKKENLKVRNFIIDKDNNLVIGNRKIPLNTKAEATLNWYGKSSTHTTRTFKFISFKDVFCSMNALKHNQKPSLQKDIFTDKIVLLGFTADGLHDIKTVPVDKVYPALEIYPTFINNVLDNNIIQKNSFASNVLISLLLGIIVCAFVLRIKSTFISLVLSSLVIIGYIWSSIYIMEHYNLWIWVFIPIVTIASSFILAYILKYILKSKDYDYAYKLATTDGLTNLYNHRFFQDQILLNISNCQRYRMQFSLILIDIDNFKKFNDVYGHLSGDAVLKQVANFLKKSVRISDIVFRYGGEEMAIILPNTNNEGANILAQRICDTVALKPFKLIGKTEKNVTISLGVATYPEHGLTPTDLIGYADECLYTAKRNGRNQVGKLNPIESNKSN